MNKLSILTPQAKLEYIIFLVREYEASLTAVCDDLAHYEGIKFSIINSGMDSDEVAHSLTSLGEPPTVSIEPQAQVYLERIEAFLSVK